MCVYRSSEGKIASTDLVNACENRLMTGVHAQVHRHRLLLENFALTIKIRIARKSYVPNTQNLDNRKNLYCYENIALK